MEELLQTIALLCQINAGGNNSAAYVKEQQNDCQFSLLYCLKGDKPRTTSLDQLRADLFVCVYNYRNKGSK